jgi:hypothetical protein
VQGQQYGLIAEEVAAVYPELVTKGADGKVESVQYHELIPMLLNEVQHQQRMLGMQAGQLTAQSQQVAELQAQNATFSKMATESHTPRSSSRSTGTRWAGLYLTICCAQSLVYRGIRISSKGI